MKIEYVELSAEAKLALLQLHECQAPFASLETRNWCLHCGKEFDGRSVRVWGTPDGSLYLECGTPECDGSPMDWFPYPWWDPHHPLTRQHEAGEVEDDPDAFAE